MAKPLLPDGLWERIKPLLPPEPLTPKKSARTELLSTTALDQSIWSAKSNSSSRTCQTFCQTPETYQSLRCRHLVMPFPHPSPGGSSS